MIVLLRLFFDALNSGTLESIQCDEKEFVFREKSNRRMYWRFRNSCYMEVAQKVHHLSNCVTHRVCFCEKQNSLHVNAGSVHKWIILIISSAPCYLIFGWPVESRADISEHALTRSLPVSMADFDILEKALYCAEPSAKVSFSVRDGIFSGL